MLINYFNIKYTFYLFKHLTFFFDDYYFEYLELFNFQLNQLILIYQYLNFLSSQKSIYNIKFTWQIACDLDDVSLATVACVVLLWLATLIICSKCLLFYADFYVNPCIWILFDLSYKIFKEALSLRRSRHLPP